MADDDPIEIDEFAMFQARSMGVETEYLEMAKAGRHQGRSSSHNRRGGEENSPGTSSGRRRGQRSSAGRQRSSRQSRGDEDDTETPYDSPKSPRQCDDAAAAREWNCRGVRSSDLQDEEVSVDVGEMEGQEGNDDGEEEESQQPLQRSHSYRSKRSSGGKQSWTEEDAMKADDVLAEQQGLVDPITCDLKRTLTMPTKRHRERPAAKASVDGVPSGRESLRSWGRAREPSATYGESDTNEEDVSKTRRSDENGEDGRGTTGRGRAEEGRVGKAAGVAWKDTVTAVYHDSSPGHDTGAISKRSCLLRNDSSGSTQLRNPTQTPNTSLRRTSNEMNVRASAGEAGRTGAADRHSHGTQNDIGGGSRSENGGGESGMRDPAGISVRVATSRVERPPPGNEVTVYKVLLLGSQGVGKSMVTQQLLAAGNEDDEDDESSDDRIVSVQVDDDETLLEFIDSAACQANRTKQVADANLVVYSVTDRASFAFAQSCLQELRPAKRHNVVILVANKQDLVRNRVISEEDGKNLAAKRHCKFIEVSALLSLKMDDLLIGIARQIRLRKGRTNAAGGAVSSQGPAADRDKQGRSSSADAGGPDSGFGCLQRAALHAIRKVFRRRPVESTSCDNLCTP